VSDVSKLFESVRFGGIDAANRLIMAPMTRGRASLDGVPTPMMTEYYAARADAGVIITEATGVSRQGLGWFGAPGIWTDAQVDAWRRIVEAVHAKGGKIMMQLWHMGRASHSDFSNGEPPVAPSAIAIKGETHTPSGKKPYETPRALRTDELPGIVADYAHAARQAKAAGFDGVEIHGANGYLIDEFIRDGSNKRTDAYGGSVENRLRLLREVTEAVLGVWGADRVGVRLSPTGAYNDMADSDPIATFTAAADLLNGFGLAYLHLMEPLPGSMMATPNVPTVHPHIRKAFNGPLILNGGYDVKSADAALAAGQADAIAFGVPFLANPDFVTRAKRGAALNAPDFNTLYSGGETGYNDYPTLPQAA
jgi:N-ethylmaleimide reductase